MKAFQSKEIIVPIHRPDSREKLFFLGAGVLLSVPFSLFFETVATDYLTSVMSTFFARALLIVILAPFIEEFAKAYPLFYRHGETQRSIISLGFLVGFGFGLTEFIEYVFGLGASFLIRLPAILFHASSTSITTYGIATKRPALFYLIAVSLHFANNLFAEIGAIWFIGGPLVIVLTVILAFRFYRRTSEKFIDQLA